MENEKLKDELLERVIMQIKTDFYNWDYEAVEEMLKFTPVENLIGYLPEEEHEKFKQLTNG